jgi:hypothetical protein
MATIVTLLSIGYGVRQVAGQLVRIVLKPMLRPVLDRLSRGGGVPSKP